MLDFPGSRHIFAITLSASQNTINEDELTIGDPLGHGGQGAVFRGKWKGMEVAVKKYPVANPKDIEILTGLGSHPNVIHLYGVVYCKDYSLLVTELVKGGSLYDFLYIKKSIPSHDQRMNWMHDIAMGMLFLHQHNIAHRDLKSANVLLGHRMAKLCDFGTARYLEQTATQTNPSGTPRWMAPEIMRDPSARINKKCDVYSYAMVMYELVELKLPFHEDSYMMAALNAMNGKRPTLPVSESECPSFLRRLIVASWSVDPDERPSFPDIIVALDTKTYP